MPIITISDYKRLTGITGVTRPDGKTLNEFKQRLTEALNNSDSVLRQSLAKLSEEQRAAIMSALVANNTNMIAELLTSYLSQLTWSQWTGYLHRITEHEQNDTAKNKNWLNAIVSLLIAKLLLFEKNSIYTHVKTTRILQQAMQQITESHLHITAKVSLSREIDYSAALTISDYAYFEPLIPLLKNRFLGNINVKEYQFAIQNGSLDYSEYSILTLGLLQSILGNKIDLQDRLNAVRQLYLSTQYEKAIDKIQKVLAEYTTMLDENVLKLTINGGSKLMEINIYKNYTRRFFENRLAQLYLGKINSLASENKICEYLLGKSVHSLKEAEHAILSLPNMVSDEIKVEYKNLIQGSFLFRLHDRCDKFGFSNKNMECQGIILGQEVYSKNKGVLTSNMPNFYDELCSEAMRNRVVDTTATIEDQTLYSYARPRSVFVASLSGHTFLIVSFLASYMRTHIQDPNLQTDINHFLKTVIAFYINRGYHSSSEIIDVLKESHIQKLFMSFNVILDLSWTDELVEQAARDTQEYTKIYCLGKATRASLNTSTFFKSTTQQFPTVAQKNNHNYHLT